MKNLYADVSGKLPRGLVEIYANVNAQAKALGIDYLVVGAMARDLVMVHGYGANIERGTRDVDFAVDVKNWESFTHLKNSLIAQGFSQNERIAHRLNKEGSDGLPWEVDIVPFGEIQDKDANIWWPPDNERVMSVLGFKEARQHALQVRISEQPDVCVPVASPAGMSLLKMVAWLDRKGNIKKKDGLDLRYLLRNYSKIPDIRNALYDDGLMDQQGWDETRAAAMKLGQDAAEIASKEILEYIKVNLLSKEARREQLVRDMGGRSALALAECSDCLDIYLAELVKDK